MRIIHLEKHFPIWQSVPEWNFPRSNIPRRQGRKRRSVQPCLRSIRKRLSIFITSCAVKVEKMPTIILQAEVSAKRRSGNSAWGIQTSTVMTCINTWNPRITVMNFFGNPAFSMWMNARACMTNSGIVLFFQSWMSITGWLDLAGEWWETASPSTWIRQRPVFLTRAVICTDWI